MDLEGISYNWQSRIIGQNVQFVFESLGVKPISKIVEYTLVNRIHNKPVFNFGFGNYDASTNTVDDYTIDNNGDVYKIFNTVLLTIPAFFTIHPGALIMVRGSDSGEDFLSACKKACTKHCLDNCRNENRRISLYKKHIERNYMTLSQSYRFFGSYLYKDPTFAIETFRLYEPYLSLFVAKK